MFYYSKLSLHKLINHLRNFKLSNDVIYFNNFLLSNTIYKKNILFIIILCSIIKTTKITYKYKI